MDERNTIIKEDYTKAEWDGLVERCKLLKPEYLAEIAEYLGAQPCSEPEDYANEFSEYTWQKFGEAYAHVMREDYSGA